MLNQESRNKLKLVSLATSFLTVFPIVLTSIGLSLLVGASFLILVRKYKQNREPLLLNENENDSEIQSNNEI